MSNLIGQRLGQYEIVSLLGKGGMATVYRARQESIGRDVAFKVIKPDLAEAQVFADRFKREARTVASFSHPHILKVFDYGEYQDTVYLVMELMTGGSLSGLIAAQGALSIETTAQLLEQISQALDYAHRRGVVHRDLKPQNVLLDDDQNAFLTDFGIAKVLNSATGALTQSGVAMGTPAYMPPEQWRGEAVDARADIYALGVMLFEMLTGRVPFQGDTPFSMMYKHLNEPPPALGTIRSDISTRIDDVIIKALAKNPEDRYESAAALAAAFNQALQGESAEPSGTLVLPNAPSGPTPALGSGRTPAKKTPTAPIIKTPTGGTAITAPARSPLIFVVAAIVVILIVAGLGALLVSNNNTANSNATGTAQALVVAQTTSQGATQVALAATASAPIPTLTATTALTNTNLPTLIPPTTIAPPAAQSPGPTTNTAGTTSVPTVNLPTTIAPPATQSSEPTNVGANPQSAKTETSTSTARPSATNKIAVSPTQTPSHTPTSVPSVTNKPTQTPSHTATNAPTATLTPTTKPTETASHTPTNPPTATATPTNTASATATATHTATPTITPSNTATTTLTNTVAPTSTPTTAAVTQGSLLVFLGKNNGQQEIFTVQGDGTHLTALTNTTNLLYPPPYSWSPDRQQIAFVVRTNTGESVWVMNADGTNPTRFTPGEGSYPVWSPDGKTIAYMGTVNGKNDIYVMGNDGSDPHAITSKGIRTVFLAWSSDSTHLLFLSGGVWVADASGQTAARQINSDTHAVSAVWAPDGYKVAVVSGTEIYTLNVQNNWAQLPFAAGKDPSWAPGSDQIVYSFDGNIYIANADGSTTGATPLAAGLQPVWSSDGKQIAYINNNALFVMDVDGSNQKQIAPNAQSPVWAPVPTP